MPFPAEAPFNPPVSKTPILGPSSGNPASFRDPSSVASTGNRIQAMTDQAKSDTLYDSPPPKAEGFEAFRNDTYSPWILKSEACKKEGFSKMELSPADYIPYNHKFTTSILVLVGLAAIFLSFSKAK
jgi:hypothetical protein